VLVSSAPRRALMCDRACGDESARARFVDCLTTTR
jgi:hypothetical protein